MDSESGEKREREKDRRWSTKIETVTEHGNLWPLRNNCAYTLIMNSSLLKAQFKKVFQGMPSPVAIITTSVSSNAPISDYHGLTVSSMTSLSLNPDPLILFNVMVPSRSSESLKAFDLFGVHLLKPSSYSIDLVRKFSQGHRSGGLITSPFDGLLKDYDFFHYDGLTKNSKLENTGGILPLLMHCDKILVCKKKNFFEVADHEIWVGEVVDTIISKHGSKSDGNLLHFNSEFYRVGTKI